MAVTNMRIVLRRDTNNAWNIVNPDVKLLNGEVGLEINTDKNGFSRPTKMKIGNDGLTWAELPYFNAGISEIDNESIIMDNYGEIKVNTDFLIGDLGDSVSVKDYVDATVTGLQGQIDSVVADLDDSVAALVAADASAADSITTLDVDLTTFEDSVNTLIKHEMWLFANQASFPDATENHGRVVHSHMDGAMFYAHEGMWWELAGKDSVDALVADLQSKIDSINATDDALEDSIIANLDSISAALPILDARTIAHDSAIAVLQANDTVQDGEIDLLQQNGAAHSAAIGALEVSVAELLSDSVTMSDLSDSVTGIQIELADYVNKTEFGVYQQQVDAEFDEIVDSVQGLNDVGTGYTYISNNNTLNDALGELDSQLVLRVTSSDTVDVEFRNVTASSYSGNLKGQIFSADGITAVLDNGATGSDAVFTGAVVGNASTATDAEPGSALDATKTKANDANLDLVAIELAVDGLTNLSGTLTGADSVAIAAIEDRLNLVVAALQNISST